jgi:hypothetical protein
VRTTRALILIYALASAALYSGLLPLWEGFDELYHFGAVQHIATSWQFAEIGKTTLSRELWNSLDYLPVSHYIQPYLERPSTSFEDYFKLTAEQRAALRVGADTLSGGTRSQNSPRINYESRQAPLTYMLLAPVEAALASRPLPTRVLVLRLVLSFLTIPLLWIGLRRLAARFGLDAPMEAAFLLVLFSCQVFYAETCRVGNDALAAPWLVWMLLAAIEAFRTPSWRRTAQAAILMGAGLLIKSYLLILTPLAFAVPAAWLLGRRQTLGTSLKHGALSAGLIVVIAGPWYGRNVLKYHQLMGTDEMSGMGMRELLRSAAGFPWIKSLSDMLHAFLWTGNNSFVTFSHSTLDVLLGLLAVSLVLYALGARRTFAEALTITSVVLYGALLVVMALVFYRSTEGQIAGAMPWYAQVVLAPIGALAFAGLSRWGRVGRWIALASVAMSTYIVAVSWLLKLVPLYGGLEDAHGRPAQLLNWYLHSGPQRASVLSALCPAPLLMVVLGTLAAASARVLAVICRHAV